MKLNELTLTNTLAGLKAKKFSQNELYADVQSAIKAKNKDLNIYLAQDSEAAVKAEKLKNSPLMGVPLAVKDNFLTKGLVTTAASKLLENFIPQYESTVTQNLKKAGAVVIGKTNMDAWAHGSSTETSDFGTTKNPRNVMHSPGGSSGGSASAVAADMCTASIGSETAGSIRLPASWCGVVGLKPTYGRVSRAGVVAMGSSLDSPGPITKTVADAALLLHIIAGKDRYDATTSLAAVPPYSKVLGKSISGLRVGIVYMDHPQLKGTEVDRSIKAAGELFEKLGAHVSEIAMSTKLEKNKILTPDNSVAVYTVVQRGEVSSNLARFDGVRFGHDRSFFGEEARRRIMLGTFTLSKGYSEQYYVNAQKVRSLYIQNFRQLFENFDVLISTPSPGFAPKIGVSAGNAMFGELTDMLNEPSSIAGICGISVPCYHDKTTNLYLGLNIMANQWQEEKILQVAHAFEQNTKWNSWLN
jgi:aspartyl-tRNA(Asn)/glutamyl-tRNA(Gln) amidotransferase subunit A